MRTCLGPLFGLFLALQVHAADIPAPSGAGIVDADARLELLFTRRAPIAGGLTEGPAVAPDGSIFFTDIPAGKDKGMILRFDPRTRATTTFSVDSGMANGLMFDALGSLIACEGADGGGRRVVSWSIQTGARTILADRFEGKRFNSPNDLCIDRRGYIYFTDPRYVGGEARELLHQAVYRISTARSVIELTREVEKPNGIILSPDMRTLYVADHNNDSTPAKRGAMKVYAFSLDARGLVDGPRKTLVDFGAESGTDGMTVDVRGNLYLTVRSLKKPGVLVVDTAGREIGFIPTGPAAQTGTEAVGLPSNCVFGSGEESSVLYVTVDKSLYRIRCKIDGFHIPFQK